MKHIILVFLLILGLMPAVHADELAAVKQLAEQGDTKAQFVLGSMYRDGRGVAQNEDEMLHWWRMAAEQGNFDAQFALGNLYSGGSGVAKDHVLAYMWFDILAAQATEGFIGRIAASNRNALKLFMTSDEIAKAKEFSADWQSKHAK
jgi:hypothetical protein